MNIIDDEEPSGAAARGADLPWLDEFKQLPADVTCLGRAELLALAADLLGEDDASNARDQVADILTRFGLDPDQARNVLAAAAYVWSAHNLPSLTRVPASGPPLDEASQAVLRCVLSNPDALIAMLRGPAPRAERAYGQIIDAAYRGLIDYEQATGAKPPGVAPELQTMSYAARRAMADRLRNGG